MPTKETRNRSDIYKQKNKEKFTRTCETSIHHVAKMMNNKLRITSVCSVSFDLRRNHGTCQKTVDMFIR